MRPNSHLRRRPSVLRRAKLFLSYVGDSNFNFPLDLTSECLIAGSLVDILDGFMDQLIVLWTAPAQGIMHREIFHRNFGGQGSIHALIHPSICQSIHACIYPCICPPIQLHSLPSPIVNHPSISFPLSVQLSVYHYIHPSVSPPTHPGVMPIASAGL